MRGAGPCRPDDRSHGHLIITLLRWRWRVLPDQSVERPVQTVFGAVSMEPGKVGQGDQQLTVNLFECFGSFQMRFSHLLCQVFKLRNLARIVIP